MDAAQNFINRVEELKKKGMIQEDAYHEAEREFFELYKVKKFANYGAFRVAKHRREKIVTKYNF